MLGTNENPNAIVLYFCDTSETSSPYFEHIPLKQKSLRRIDYQQPLSTILQNYTQSHDISHLQQIFERILVMGEGFGAVVANQIAHQYGLRALLINPIINLDNNFSLNNTELVHILIEESKIGITRQDYERFFQFAPVNWTVDYVKADCFGGMQDLQTSIAELCDCGWAWIDDATWFEDD